jgi:hypothetical protein
MAVDLTRGSPALTEQNPVEKYRAHIRSRMLDDYCSSSEYRSLIKQGLELQVDPQMTEKILDLALESSGIANETRLLQELEAALFRFTGADKKLDPKEKNDALQMVCKARPGYKRGLSFETAESTITMYCRNHSIKLKTGIFSWTVP